MNNDKIMSELNELISSVKQEEFEAFAKSFSNADIVVGYGAGRMGLSLKAFIMRLNHLGIKAYYYGDTYIPPLTSDSIFIFSSGSGNTQTVVDLASVAKSRSNCRIAAITGNSNSKLGQMADILLTYKSCNGGLNSPDSPDKISSCQIMSTLNEQGTYILYDMLTLEICSQNGIVLADTKKFHSNVE